MKSNTSKMRDGVGADMTRRGFVAGAMSALASGFLPTGVLAAGEDWRTAFRAMGFDPSAAGSGTFAVVADVHVDTSENAPFRNAVAFWNAMSPQPAFALSCGDQLCFVSDCFGDNISQRRPDWRDRNEKGIALFKEIIAPCQMPFKHVIGNHDTFPGETDAAYYAGHFPGWRPYERYDALGVQFLLLNGGHDGWIDPRQEAWLKDERQRLDPRRAVLLVVHQPSMLRHRENGIPQTISRVFGDWKGELWVLGGHEHFNRLERFELSGGGTLGVATHARGPRGFWLYGVRNGSVAARLFYEPTGLQTGEFGPSRGTFTGWATPRRGEMPSAITSRGPLPLPFDGVNGILWRTFVGEGDSTRDYAVEVSPHSDAGHWYYYIGRIVYRLPLAARAPQARRVAFLGELRHHRKTGEREKVYLSANGRDWTLCADVAPAHDLYVYSIPTAMRGAEWLYVRVDGFGFGNDSCIAGYALLA